MYPQKKVSILLPAVSPL